MIRRLLFILACLPLMGCEGCVTPRDKYFMQIGRCEGHGSSWRYLDTSGARNTRNYACIHIDSADFRP